MRNPLFIASYDDNKAQFHPSYYTVQYSTAAFDSTIEDIASITTGQYGPQGTLQIQLAPHTFSVQGKIGVQGVIAYLSNPLLIASYDDDDRAQFRPSYYAVPYYLALDSTIEDIAPNMIGQHGSQGIAQIQLAPHTFSVLGQMGSHGIFNSSLSSTFSVQGNIGVQADVTMAGPTVYITGAGGFCSRRVYTVHITTVPVSVHITTVPVNFITDTTII
jgi:hypothetical protein